ncbi:MAG: hypothetical protein FJ117_20135 [Deltaproteobacteria bacterium]|nr:hypothetical protein [Deltaproteobacteria bacterium]
MNKKILVGLVAILWVFGVAGFGPMAEGKGLTQGEITGKNGKKAAMASGEVGYLYFAQVNNRVVNLTGPSSQKIYFPPPCTVIRIEGRKVILKDFYGKEESVMVESAEGIRVGDKVVVKHGAMRIGISLE